MKIKTYAKIGGVVIDLDDLKDSDEDFLFETARAYELFEDGNKDQLLRFLDYCLSQNRPVPDWTKAALRSAFHKAWSFEIKSWDEVFGRPLKKGKQLAAQRRRLQLAAEVYKRVNARRRAGEPIQKDLFDAVGKELDIGGTLAGELFYAVRDEIFRR